MRGKVLKVLAGVLVGAIFIFYIWTYSKYDHARVKETASNLSLEVKDLPSNLSQKNMILDNRENGLYEDDQLGCHLLSPLMSNRLQELYNSPKQYNAKQPFRHSLTMELDECKKFCLGFIYIFFVEKMKYCYCDNLFNTSGLATLPCGNNSKSAIVFISGNASEIKYSRLRTAGIDCVCQTAGCPAVSCKPSAGSSLYFYGSYELKQESDDTIRSYHLVSKSDNSEYSVKDLVGFSPILTSVEKLPAALDSRLYSLANWNRSAVMIPLTSNNPRTKILLVTFMRGGSSFFSEFFKENHDSFFAYEPLFSLMSDVVAEAHETGDHHQMSVRSIELLHNLLSCQFDKIPVMSFSRFQMKLNDFMDKCDFSDIEVRFTCIQLLIHQCMYQPMTVVKVIRAKVSWMESLLENHSPDLKIILLMRDPRGIVNSRIPLQKRGILGVQSISERSKALCHAMMDDIINAKRLAALYPKKVFALRYEDLVEDLGASIENVYKMLQLGDVPKYLKTNLKNLSTKSVKKDGAFSVHRADSKRTAYKWKEVLKFTSVQEIDEICAEAYSYAGYLPIKDEQELRNTSYFPLEMNYVFSTV